MRRGRSYTMADRSLAALTAAVSAYNRPSEPYRFEQFAIMLCNAWELLLKARIMQLNKHKASSIFVYEKRQRADGTTGTKLYRKKTKSGNTMTIGLMAAFDRLANKNAENLPEVVRSNLEAVIEIRDTATHYFHDSHELLTASHQVFAASVSNHLRLLARWFGKTFELEGHTFLPIALIGKGTTVEAKGSEKRLIKYLESSAAACSTEGGNGLAFALTVRVEAIKSKSDDAARYSLTRDPKAQPLRLEEESIRDQFPWDYQQVAQRARDRYTNFSQNKVFHQAMKQVKADPTLHHRRLLDPDRPKGGGKDFYSPNIFKNLDQFWTRKAAKLSA